MDFHIGPETVTVTLATRGALMDAVQNRLTTGKGFALATLNLDHLVKLRRNPAFLRAYQAQDLVVADGNPIVWLSRLARQPVELMPGSELVVPLARLAADCGRGVALLGSSDAALEGAARALQAQIPGLQITACLSPPMGFDPESAQAADLLRRIGASGAGLCFVALGAPKQEILAARGREFAPATGFASIGAGLDFLSGHQTRAPAWVQRLALEWLWRMLSSPRRLAGRYLACAALLPELLRDAMRQRKA